MNKAHLQVDPAEVERVKTFVRDNSRQINDDASVGNKAAQFIIQHWPAFCTYVDAGRLGEMIGAVDKYKKDK